MDIYIQKVDADGNIHWAPNGTAICTEDFDQNEIDLFNDGSGGAIITWEDFRSDSDNDIYAHRISDSGELLWDDNGTIICNETGDQRVAKVCRYGEEDFIIVWMDSRDIAITGYDIYAQRVGPNGNPAWTLNGKPVCTDLDNSLFPQICSDGKNGVIVTWEDNRGLDFDIYAQIILDNGDMGWGGNGTVVCCPDISVSKAELYFAGKKTARCCGIWCDWLTREETRVADCQECYLYKEGCFIGGE